MTDIISRIYKITNPIGEIYIGFSSNIEKRFEKYYNQRCNEQPKLFKSLCKYGYINHKFEVIEYCNIKELKIKERYWQEYYNCIEIGLDSKADKCGKYKSILSDETRYKMGNSFRGKATATSIKVKCLLTNTIYRSIKECADMNNINYNTLKQKLNGTNKSKSNQFIYLKDEVI